MNPISQSVMPRAFELLRSSSGGAVGKPSLVLQYYFNRKRILEAGCSKGRMAAAFLGRDMERARQ